MPPLCRETQSLGQQMLNAPFGINGLMIDVIKRERKPVKLHYEYTARCNRQNHCVRKAQVKSVRWRGGSVRWRWDRGEGVVMERIGGEWEACDPAISHILGPLGTGFSLSRSGNTLETGPTMLFLNICWPTSLNWAKEMNIFHSFCERLYNRTFRETKLRGICVFFC